MNEQERRNKIRRSLLCYYRTEKGIAHRKRLSELQKIRMTNYAIYLRENNNIKTNCNEEIS
ncbi:hypothetical protein ACJEEO_07230 [Phocaeicola coprocola]|uniref:hypothetical protein n=1 Tax=Phocaeicola coprocola TaxID=310298 RepID=UPI00397E7202